MVYVDLNPLLNPDAPPQIAGWFPIYDTLRGLLEPFSSINSRFTRRFKFGRQN